MKLRLAITAIFASAMAGGLSFAGPIVTVGTNVAANQRVPMNQIDHGLWDRLLQHYVDPAGNVSYTEWKGSTADVQALDRYLTVLSSADLSAHSAKPVELAFWINAYNAMTIRGILREYPTTSIRNHTARIFGYNIWNDLQLQVGGQSVSLRHIEHEVLRKMGDPKIHFAIVCASQSCPRLRNQAYTPRLVDDQIAENAKLFFADPRNFQFDARRGQMKLSAILKWFADDFGSSQRAQLRTIAPYLPSRQAYDAAVANTVSISYLGYDWGLNDQATLRSARR